MPPMVSVSIILTCYNLEKYIEEALISCFQQDYTGPKELIIVDDASTDGSVDIINRTIEQYGEGWDVTFIQRPVNGGISAAMDSAMAVAKHEWLIWADGDDIQLGDRCSKTVQLIEQYPEAFSIHLSRENINAEGISRGKCCGPLSVSYDSHPEAHCQHTPEERLNNYKEVSSLKITEYGCAMAMRKKLWTLWGNAVPDDYCGERYAQDPLWACRAYLSGAAVASKYVACKYRSHDSNILNYHRDLLSFKGQKKNELYRSRYAAKEAAQLRKSLDDIDRAIENPALTDWNSEQLRELRAILAKRLLMKDSCSYWWDKPIWVRLIISIRIRHIVPSFMKFWLIARIFPLNVYCFAKTLRTRLKAR